MSNEEDFPMQKDLSAFRLEKSLIFLEMRTKIASKGGKCTFVNSIGLLLSRDYSNHETSGVCVCVCAVWIGVIFKIIKSNVGQCRHGTVGVPRDLY